MEIEKTEKDVFIRLKNISATELTFNPEEITERFVRESKGNTAYTIVESDDLVPEDIADTIRRNKNVYNVMVVQM